MPSNANSPSHNRVKGWLLDVYPSSQGEVTVWIIGEHGERIQLTDKFEHKIYVSGEQGDIERLASGLYANHLIASWNFVHKYVQPTDNEKTRVLELSLKDCRQTRSLSRSILKMGDYLHYKIHNCDLDGERAYLFSHDLFPLAFVEVKNTESGLDYTLLDTVINTDYRVPQMRIMKLQVHTKNTERFASFNDPIDTIHLVQAEKQAIIESGDETDKLLKLVKFTQKCDPDIILTTGGDSYLFPYLIQRAIRNAVLEKLVLSRDGTPFTPKKPSGRTFFSYGRTFYRATATRLYGRIHLDENNTFALKEAGLEGLIEIARTCRVPLHRAARSSIGSSMSSLQFYQAMKDDVLIPRNKSIPEAFKSSYELFVGDRGGFVYEPRVGIHENVGELDFTSLYPSLMVKNNISAETVLCNCCPNSSLRLPDLNYNVCQKRRGIVPKSLELILSKRLAYKRLQEEARNNKLKETYGKRQIALKWILVTCFGYLGYRNAKFGTVDGHIGVCAFGREALLKTASIAERHGFNVIHGIVDSLWLHKNAATSQEYHELCKAARGEIEAILHFQGLYKWIVFLPSKIHPNIGVLNRYYGVMQNGDIKVRGIEVRRRDTPRFIYDAQMEMLRTLTSANNVEEFYTLIPGVFNIVKKYRRQLLNGEIPIWNLIIKKRLSKSPKKYKKHISQAIAAEQLMSEGAEVHAGKSVSFLITNFKNKRYNRRIKAKELIETGVNPDTEKYLSLLYASAASLLSFAGYTTKTIHETIDGYSRTSIIEY